MGTSCAEADVLLVDDDEADVAVALFALQQEGWATRTAVRRDGIEALEYLQDVPAPPRLIVLDLRMPRLGGLEVLRQVRADARFAQVPIVVVSSSNLESDVVASYREGANSFVRKRLEPERPGRYIVDIARYWLELNETRDGSRGSVR